MRDLILIVLLPYLVYVCFKRAYLGLALWLWSSLVPIIDWSYGIATSIRWNLIFAVCTILSYLLQQNKEKARPNGLFWLMILFLIHATISSSLNIGFDAEVWLVWNYFLKSTIFGVFVALIVRKKLHFVALSWACALSISVKAAIDGIKFVLSGGGHRIGSISKAFDDNNLSALAVLMCLPFLFYLYSEFKHVLLFKVGFLGLIVTNILFIIGSDSRGAFLGLLVLAAFFFLRSPHKFKISISLIIIVAVALPLMDKAWFERMETIKTADEDESFMGRVISWKLATILAIRRPIFGGGFNAASYEPTWSSLASDFHMLSFISTPEPHTIHVAHSIYFQVLGDLGFVGLFYYLILLYLAYRTFNKARKSKLLSNSLRLFATYLTLAIIAFAVAGAALSSAYNSLFFMLIGLTTPLSNILKSNQKFQ